MFSAVFDTKMVMEISEDDIVNTYLDGARAGREGTAQWMGDVEEQVVA